MRDLTVHHGDDDNVKLQHSASRALESMLTVQ
jgi:hypothetical protein